MIFLIEAQCACDELTNLCNIWTILVGSAPGFMTHRVQKGPDPGRRTRAYTPQKSATLRLVSITAHHEACGGDGAECVTCDETGAQRKLRSAGCARLLTSVTFHGRWARDLPRRGHLITH